MFSPFRFFVFALVGSVWLLWPAAAGAAATVTDKSAAGELVFWNSVKESTDPADIKVYIDEFPNGMFIDPAIARYEQMTGQRLASLPEQDETVAPPETTPPVAKKKATAKKKVIAKKKAVTKQKVAKKKRAVKSKKIARVERRQPVRTKALVKKRSTCTSGVIRNGKCIVLGGGGSGGGGGWN
jgi:hypothetical protein